MEEKKKYNFLMPLLLAFVLVIGMQLGFKLRDTTLNKRSLGDKGTFGKLDEIMNLINIKYVDDVDAKDVLDKALDKFLVDLDPHSFYIPESDLKGVKESLEGKFEGIGIEFYIVKDTIVVVTPISGGPSEALGILSGDKIITINDTLVAGKSITNNDVVKKLRGDKGTKVKVGIYRKGTKELVEYKVTRDKIPLFSVDVGYMVDTATGYIKINRFAENTYDEFRVQMNKLREAGMKKLIVDVRQNPGGYLNAATLIADEFIDEEKLLVYTEGKAYKRNDYNAKNAGQFEKGNLVILIDEGSASASEILAGAIQDWDRGVVVGRRSFGKGLVQEQYELNDGSALRLTVARYYTPSGRSIQKPYDDGNEAYNNEIYDRFESGELTTDKQLQKADTTNKFFTADKRVVYGGGGIGPDVFVAVDTSYSLSYFFQVRSFIPEFMYNYYSENQGLFTQYKESQYFRDNFNVTDALYNKFLAYAYKEGLSKDEKALQPVASKIKTVMKAYLAKQMWKDDGFYPVMNTIDEAFLKAYEVVQNPNEYLKKPMSAKK
jgi:carboxyl-terminal processing protease